jgi:Mrp family chromosome partitioning ATPase
MKVSQKVRLGLRYLRRWGLSASVKGARALKQLVILSGKGGTGKTSVAAALADLASEEIPIVLADADVDAANLDLVLDPTRLL